MKYINKKEKNYHSKKKIYLQMTMMN